MNKRAIITYGSIGVALATTVYIIYNRNQKKKQIEQIISDIQGGVSETGTAVDALKLDAFKPTYYKTVKQGTPLFRDAVVTQIAKNIYDSLKGWNNSAKTVAEFRKFGNKAQVSQVSEKFANLYSTSLNAYLDDQLRDPSPIGGYSLTPNDQKAFETIMDIVKGLPN